MVVLLPCLLRALVSICWPYFVLCSSGFRACDPISQFPLENWLFSLSLPGPHTSLSLPPAAPHLLQRGWGVPPMLLPPFHLAMSPALGYTLIHAGKEGNYFKTKRANKKKKLKNCNYNAKLPTQTPPSHLSHNKKPRN